jgi:biopolymer transport protein TolQ
MSGTQDLSILAMVASASVVVQLVMLLLLVVSFMSWYFIFLKVFTIGRAKRKTEHFERDFWSGSDLAALYQSAVNHRHSTGSLERIFEAGFREFAKLKSQRGAGDPSLMVDGARRAMRATFQREMDRLDANLAFLASVGSVSPYVGLLGTVWGIMHAFRGLSNMAQATLAAVAPGIAEALVATAIGLMAAIPAVMAYNYFSRRIRVISSDMETFSSDFLNIVRRRFF